MAGARRKSARRSIKAADTPAGRGLDKSVALLCAPAIPRPQSAGLFKSIRAFQWRAMCQMIPTSV